MQLSAHFTLADMVASATAARLGIDNTPDTAQIAALAALCTHILEPLRERVSRPLTVSSGFRSAALNHAVDGAGASQHCRGEAADLVCAGMPAAQLFRTVVDMALPFDQLIYEGGRRTTWVHVSYRAEHRRGRILRATFSDEGGVLYTELDTAAARMLIG